MIKVIISDLAGVFLNEGVGELAEYLKNEFGIPEEIMREKFKKNYIEYASRRTNAEGFWKTFLEDVNVKEDWQKMRDFFLNIYEINEKVSNFFEEAKAKGIKLILLSNQIEDWWEYLNNKFKIESYFDEIIVSHLTNTYKPNPDIYEIAIEVSGVKPEECLFIDDLERNLGPAEKIGIKTLLFENAEKLGNDLRELKII